MANDISISIGGADGTGIEGLYARALSGGSLGDPIPLLEVEGSGGVYVGSMVGAAGEYTVLAYRADGTLIGSTGKSYRWDGLAFAEGFLAGDRAAVEATRDRLEKLAKRQGLEAGVSATVKDAAPGQPGQLVTSDGAIVQTMTVNNDGSVTIENAAD